LANSAKVFEFLNTKGKDSIGKMANELDMKAQGYTADLTTLTLKLGFVYELKKEGFSTSQMISS
jgi:hypothetical protein